MSDCGIALIICTLLLLAVLSWFEFIEWISMVLLG